MELIDICMWPNDVTFVEVFRLGHSLIIGYCSMYGHAEDGLFEVEAG
jgi:hypothetical protein